MKYLIFILVLSFATGCATDSARHESFREWKEEVQLNDGRVIVVTQKKRCEGAYTGGNYAPCIAREAWLTIDLPEFNVQPIVWHENLSPIVLNVHQGRLYLVADFPTQREFRLYGEPQPPYLGFVWKDNSWQRISFEAVPEAIYDVNMLLEAYPAKEAKFLTLSEKEGPNNNGDRRIRKSQKRLDPSRKWGD